MLLRQEGNRWILTIAAYLGEQIPPDQAGLYEFVRGMATPALYDVIEAKDLCDSVRRNDAWISVTRNGAELGQAILNGALQMHQDGLD